MSALLNLLAEKPEISDDGFPIDWLGIGEGLIYALVGFVVTFLGICILIFFVWLYGKIIRAVGKKISEKKKAAPAAVAAKAEETEEEIPVEVKLAIIAAIAAYYDGEKSRCEFNVKRIKRL